MKTLTILTIGLMILALVSCNKDDLEPIDNDAISSTDTTSNTPNNVDTTTVSSTDTTTTQINYGTDNDGTYNTPCFALRICGATSGQNIGSYVDSIVFTNYDKNYSRVVTNDYIDADPYLFWGNVTGSCNGQGIGMYLPGAIIETNDLCNLSVYFSEDQGVMPASEMGFIEVPLISEAGGMQSPTHYSHTDNY